MPPEIGWSTPRLKLKDPLLREVRDSFFFAAGYRYGDWAFFGDRRNASSLIEVLGKFELFFTLAGKIGLQEDRRYASPPINRPSKNRKCLGLACYVTALHLRVSRATSPALARVQSRYTWHSARGLRIRFGKEEKISSFFFFQTGSRGLSTSPCSTTRNLLSDDCLGRMKVCTRKQIKSRKLEKLFLGCTLTS